MVRLVKREVKGTDYAYLEEDVYYGSKREIISVYMGPFIDFQNYDTTSEEAKTKIFVKILENNDKGAKLYKIKHLNEKAAQYFEFARYLIRIFYDVTPQDEIKNYVDAFYTQYTQGTTAIEGNTCTLRETDLILNEGISVGGKELREIYEIENYKKLRIYADSHRGDVTEEFIKQINEIVLDKIDVPKGGYRKVGVAIRGTTFEPPPAAVVESQMSELVDWYNKESEDNLHPVEIVALFHQQFEEVHPFAEGNGRTGREILNFILKKNGFPPIFFGRTEREQYLHALDAGNEGNHIPLIRFISWRVLESAKSYKKQVIDKLGSIHETVKDESEKAKVKQRLETLNKLFENTIKMTEDGMKTAIEEKSKLDKSK
jgi:Fic family protein